MFPFGQTILLISMGTGHMMSNTNTLEKRIQGLVFTTPVSLDG
jgi:hypothetical protein